MKSIRHFIKVNKITSLLFLCLFVIACQKEKTKPEPNFCSQIHNTQNTSLSKELSDIDSLMQHKTGVYVLEDGAESMVARAWLTEHAEKSIDIQYFIFSMDNVGLIACDYLVRAADRGVKIRILIDDIMVDADEEDLLVFASHENISLKIYNPGVNLGKNLFQKIGKFTTDFRGANQRMHNKTFVVDDHVVITGGRNIADEYFDFDHRYNFRDRDILLIGKGSGSVKQSFDQFWNSELSVDIHEVVDSKEFVLPKKPFDKLHNYACNPANFWPQVQQRIKKLPTTFDDLKSKGLVWLDTLRFVSDIPGKNGGRAGLEGSGVSTETLIQLVKEAKKSIDIQTPYLITTQESRALFRAAVQHGVEIRILTNSLASTDNLEAFSGYQRDREELLKTGVEIYEYKPDAAIRKKVMSGALQEQLNHQPIFGLHAKTMVIDSQKTVIGTFNLDPRSTHLNTECFVVLDSKEIAHGVLKGMEEEFQTDNSWRTTSSFNPDSYSDNYKRLKTWTRRVVPKGIL